jgi:hypothetical protein
MCHVMCHRVRVVGPGDFIDGNRHGNRVSRPNQGSRVAHAFGSDVVLRSRVRRRRPMLPSCRRSETERRIVAPKVRVARFSS